MRVTALLFLLCAHSELAIAQTAEQCAPTPKAGDLLGCYNGTTPSPAPGKRATSRVTTAQEKPAVSKTPTDPRVQADDMLSIENKKLDAKVKSLCRGC
jgi:hypothetical protein